MIVWVLFVALGFCTGWFVQRWWSILVWPSSCMALAIWEVADEPPNYDMHGFGYYFGGFVAILIVLAWLGGRALTAWHDPTERRDADR